MCSCNGKENKLIIFEGALSSIYRFASILSCVYRTVAMKNESSCAKHLNFQGNTITSNGIEIDSSIIISDIIEENIVTV